LGGRNKFPREGSLAVEHPAFRQEDDGSKPIPSHKFEVRLISQKEAKPFIERWHYSKRCPTGKNIFFGAYLGDTLYAVADYGIGVNPAQAAYLARVTGLPVTKSNLMELKRLCRIEPPMDLKLTKFLRICHVLLRREGVKFVVSFSDPANGHHGGIYKAANFIHLGKSNAEWHLVDKNGRLRHRLYAFRYARRKGIPLVQARHELGVERVRTVAKDRWFLAL
jgi:hypothetical protein